MRVIAVASWLVLLGAPPFDGLAHAAPTPAVIDCATEAATLVRQESELPRLDVVSPQDKPVVCITIETVMAFAGRVKTHLAHCPGSTYAASAADWEKTRADYAKRFTQRRCRRTLFD